MKQIPLYPRSYRNPVLYALVDDEDYEFLSRFSWFISGKGKLLYAATKINDTQLTMQSVLFPDLPKNLEVDHKNNNTLDNQRLNLRPTTHSNNLANREKQKNNTSGYKGVSYDKSRDKWQAQLVCKGVKISIGRFSTKEKAALAYNKEAFKHFGEFAKLNQVG